MDLLSGADILGPLSVLERVRIIEGVFRENIGHFAGTKGTVRNRGVSVLERCS